MIQDHEDSYCRQGHHWTIGPRCQWCLNTPYTTRFSPEIETQRAESYKRFRARGVSHVDAIALLEQIHVLVGTGRAENARNVRDLVNDGREVFAQPAGPIVRPLFAPAPVAVAA